MKALFDLWVGHIAGAVASETLLILAQPTCHPQNNPLRAMP